MQLYKGIRTDNGVEVTGQLLVTSDNRYLIVNDIDMCNDIEDIEFAITCTEVKSYTKVVLN